MRSLLGARPDWSDLVARVGGVADLEGSAREHGALVRARKVRRAEDLLRLALMYGPGRLSLRGAALAAGDAGLAEMSDKAVEGRLRRCGDWLAYLLARLLAARTGGGAGGGAGGGTAPGGGLRLSLVDSTVVCRPGSDRPDWRLHARYDPDRALFADLVLTDGRGGEAVSRTRLSPGRLTVLDRGYARVRDIAAVLGAGGAVLVRTGWRSLVLRDAGGDRLDPLALLPADAAAVSRPVCLAGIEQPLRLVIAAAPPDKAAAARRRTARRASKRSQQLDARTLHAAGYLLLVTSLPEETPAEAVVTLYRARWQVELAFKRLKSLGGLGDLPASNPDLARTWLLAHLIAAVLTDDLASAIVGFPPSPDNA